LTAVDWDMDAFRPCLILAALVLAACTPKPEGKPYQLGYDDGCTSAYSLAGKPGYDARYTRNETMFKTDEDYRRGWKAGERSCFGTVSDRSVGVGIGVGASIGF
jgi:hypothetical protein